MKSVYPKQDYILKCLTLKYKKIFKGSGGKEIPKILKQKTCIDN